MGLLSNDEINAAYGAQEWRYVCEDVVTGGRVHATPELSFLSSDMGKSTGKAVDHCVQMKISCAWILDGRSTAISFKLAFGA
jgi:hypothetical protein